MSESNAFPTGPGKCGMCNQLGLRSTVSGGDWGVSTLMGSSSFYDEDGNRHNHDPNSTGYEYQCSQGHRWHENVHHACDVKGCSVTGSRDVTYV